MIKAITKSNKVHGDVLDFDGETGELHVKGDNGKVIKYRMVKEVQVL